jgi:hypothetical protein
VNAILIFIRSGIREPMTTRAMSCFVVLPVIHPIKECVSQSGMLLPPFKATSVPVELPGSEKKIQCERDGRERSKID